MGGTVRGRPLPNISDDRGGNFSGGILAGSTAATSNHMYNTRGAVSRGVAARRGFGQPFRGLMPIPRPRVTLVSSTNTRSMTVRTPGANGSAAHSVVLDSKMSFPKNVSLSSPRYGEHLATLEANLERMKQADNVEEDDVVSFDSPNNNADGNEEADYLSPNAFAHYYAEREAGLAIARAKG